MPASHPMYNETENLANPGAEITAPYLGSLVTYDAFSGPKASLFDARTFDYSTGTPAGWDATTKLPITVNDPANLSTGALSTGIGFGSPPVMTPVSASGYSNEVYGMRIRGFTDDYKPGISTPTPTDSPDATYMYIGGGRSDPDGTPDPYVTGFAIGAFGNGADRDAGVGLGRGMKSVTAIAVVAIGADVELGWTNNSNVPLFESESVFGVGAALVAPTLDDPEVLLTDEEVVELAEEEEEDEAPVTRSRGRTRR